MPKVPRSIGLEPELWAMLETEAKRRGCSLSALVSTIVADKFRPTPEDVALGAFKSLSKMATLGLVSWNDKQKPSY